MDLHLQELELEKESIEARGTLLLYCRSCRNQGVEKHFKGESPCHQRKVIEMITEYHAEA